MSFSEIFLSEGANLRLHAAQKETIYFRRLCTPVCQHRPVLHPLGRSTYAINQTMATMKINDDTGPPTTRSNNGYHEG